MLIKSLSIKFVCAVVLLTFFSINASAQQNSFSLNDTLNSKDDVVMTWDKNTPETEMNDDVKALSKKGITIKYSNIKRNSQNEITAIKVEYVDRKGNKGNLEYNNQNPISQIVFFKQNDAIGFGQASNGDSMFVNNPFMNGFANADDIMKQFNINPNDKDSHSFNFSLPNNGQMNGKSKSRIEIQKDGKKPLIIEDGVVIEGADDYSPEEIEKLDLKEHITLLKWTKRSDVLNIISNSKLYISTARYEGLPYSIIESLALSKPCVVSNCDGNRDLIIQN